MARMSAACVRRPVTYFKQWTRGRPEAPRPPIAGLFRASGTVVLQSLIETRNQAFLAERLAQEAECSRVQCPLANALLGIGGHEDHRRAMAIRCQMALQVDPAHARHLHIGNQTSAIAQTPAFHKLLLSRPLP